MADFNNSFNGDFGAFSTLPVDPNACYLLLETGGHLLFEDDSGLLLLETCDINGDTHDGGHWTERDYKRHRRKLELLAKAGERFNESKYLKEANKVREIIQEIPISAPVIEKVAAKEVELDPRYFEEIQKELALALEYLNAQIEYKQRLRLEAAQELEDEQILMMLI